MKNNNELTIVKKEIKKLQRIQKIWAKSTGKGNHEIVGKLTLLNVKLRLLNGDYDDNPELLEKVKKMCQ